MCLLSSGHVSCDCDYHDVTPQIPPVPWLPTKPLLALSGFSRTQNKKTANQPTKNVPGLLSIAQHLTNRSIDASVVQNSHPEKQFQQDDEANEMMHAQIRLNATAMQEIETLREDRKKLMMEMEMARKENDVFKAKYSRANEQLTYLKSKMMKQNLVAEVTEAPLNDKKNDVNKTNKIVEAGATSKTILTKRTV